MLDAIPGARVRWRYRLVIDGFAVVLPAGELPRLARVPGVAAVWPSVRYHGGAASAASSPELIGAEKLWGPGLATAGNGMKIGIIDDGIDASHPYFAAAGLSYPPGFPKGQVELATPKVIVQRAFAPASPPWKYASRPFDPSESFHGTHVAGIAAGDHATSTGRSTTISGVAPNAYLGNYKALSIPTPDFGLDGNAAEIAAAIEAAVADGMDVINLSLGEPEVEPSRDLVVRALEGAARAGVVPVVAAGNDFDEFGFGSISSPANAPSAITVAATTASDTIADFSSAGPTPVSLQLKPDVSAPGVAITSSLPSGQGGPWGQLGGTSMASPHVAGAAALLKERHPAWTVAEIKSALVQTAQPVRDSAGREVSVLREGGGEVDLPRADNPLLFATPASVTFPVNGGTRSVAIADAGGGGGSWNVALQLQGTRAGVSVTAPTTVSVPGELVLTASVAADARSGDVTGFAVLTRGAETRRIPFWLDVDHPVLAGERWTRLAAPGLHKATTAAGERLVSSYRYPSGGDGLYPGPEVVFRVTISRTVSNFGVAVVSGRAAPHVVFAGDENHLAGYPGVPQALNPYFKSFGEARPVAGAVLPARGAYDVVFDTRSAAAAGRFEFRFWVDDTRPPKLALVSAARGTIVVSATDRGSGVDPQSISATVDGHAAQARFSGGRVTIRAAPGRHDVAVTASDYQELKNMEDVARIKPNTATLKRTVVVSG
ncbi:MAG TPA: S8 family serine peptidase [Gaiellaceae bacterium]|nr:S8 family serine peptidase [Gaiellaceae bacterium]